MLVRIHTVNSLNNVMYATPRTPTDFASASFKIWPHFAGMIQNVNKILIELVIITSFISMFCILCLMQHWDISERQNKS